jgi:hypothetical protein
MTGLPRPRRVDAQPRELVGELRTHWEERRVVDTCVGLLQGSPAEAHRDVLPYLAGRAALSYLDRSWAEYWPRVWGARGLLYVWDDAAEDAVRAGLADPAWRVAEMCLKVATRHELPVGDEAAALARHPLPRVREAAVRALGAAGDTEHVAVVVAALSDEAAEVRRAADRALDRMADRLPVERPGG